MLAALLVGAVGCLEEESPVSKAILADVNTLTFEAKGAAAQSFNVISEGDWTAIVPEWVSMDVMAGGAGQTAVSITVADNFVADQMQLPRQDTLLLKGANVYADFVMIIKQNGDTYLGAPNGKVSDALALASGTRFILNEGQVVALSKKGYVVSDGTSNIYLDDPTAVTVGDNLSLKGLRSEFNGVASITSCEGVTVTGNSAVNYGNPQDITESIASYSSNLPEYVAVKGVLKGSKVTVTVGETETVVTILDPTDDLGLADLNSHIIELKGYYAGADEKTKNIIAATVTDLGLPEGAQKIYFTDDFSWVAPWADKYGSADSITDNDPSGKAPNVYTQSTHQEGGVEEGYPAFLTEFANRGYEDINASAKSFYTQKYYLKFGKTSAHTGIKFPANEFEGSTPVDIILKFNWAAHMTGNGAIDKVHLVVEIEGDGTCDETGGKLSNTFATTQPDGTLAWQDAELKINGVTNSTRIIVRPTVLDDSDGVTQKRWYIDNIEIMSADAMIEAEPALLFYDQFNGNENKKKIADYVVTFIGDGSDGVTYTAGSQVDFRNTYKQGSGDYVSYENTLWPELACTPGLHLYPGTGTYNAEESWFQMNDIKVLSYKKIAFGMGMFGVGDADKYAARSEVETPLPILYKFDNQTEWTKLADAKFNYNWTWVVFPDIAVPSGAKTISFRFEPLNSNYVRVDDVTVVGK